jgi:hypothetical protein
MCPANAVGDDGVRIACESDLAFLPLRHCITMQALPQPAYGFHATHGFFWRIRACCSGGRFLDFLAPGNKNAGQMPGVASS